MSFDIYIHSAQTSPMMEYEGRSGLEYALEDFMGNAGRISGAGFGIGSHQWNLDLELDDDDRWCEWVERLVRFLREWGVPADADLVVVPPGWQPGEETIRVDVFGAENPYVEVVPPPAEVGESEPEPEPRPEDFPPLGATYLVPLEGGIYGACRVIRINIGEYATLVAGTDWFGVSPPSLTDPRLQSLLIHTCLGAVGPSCKYWLVGKPPDEFRYLGVIEPTESESRLDYGQHTHYWSHLAGSLQMQWSWLQHRQAAVAESSDNS